MCVVDVNMYVFDVSYETNQLLYINSEYYTLNYYIIISYIKLAEV